MHRILNVPDIHAVLRIAFAECFFYDHVRKQKEFHPVRLFLCTPQAIQKHNQPRKLLVFQILFRDIQVHPDS